MLSHSIDDPSNKDVKTGKRLSLLSGVKVIDMTRFLAGPFGSMILADLGATVLKVEPVTGDTSRENPPHYFEGDSAPFIAVNRNKESIAMDVRSPEGKEILSRLVARSDIILDNLRAPQRKALGLSYPDLEKINPQIISCSVTGFGSDGPYSDRPAYDIIVEALAGVMSVTGPTGGPSVRAGVPIGDVVAGIYMAVGALAGLQNRKTTGHGEHIDISMLDSQVSLLSYLAQYYFTGGVVASHQGRGHMSQPLYNAFPTGDGGEIVMAANTQEMFESLCKVLGRPEMIEDPRFLTRKDRHVNRDALVSALEAEMQKWTAEDLHEALVKVEVPVAPINPIDVALHNPQVRHRDMVVKVPHRKGSEFLSVGSPIKSERAVGEDYVSPPGLGSQTEAALREVGYSDEEIARLAKSGVIKLYEG